MSLREQVSTFDPESDGDLADLEGSISLSLAAVDRLRRVMDRAKRAEGAAFRPALARIAMAASPSRQELNKFARYLLSSRRERDTLFPDMGFGEPIWDMMLDLYVSQLDDQDVCVSSLCLAAAVPQTTAMRWIGALEAAGHFLREPDRRDHRRTLIRLSPELTDGLERHIAEMRKKAVEALS